MSLFLLVFAVILLVLFIFIANIYNSLVQLKVRSQNAWSDIDVQLKRRYDLIPNLVETVKGYAGHERNTLEAVINARAKAMGASGAAQKGEAENFLTGALKSLFALAENYPQLKANENFLKLQADLSAIEETLSEARRYYNAVIRDLNTMIQTFPNNVFAGMFGFTSKDFFQLDDAQAERKAPQVKF